MTKSGRLFQRAGPEVAKLCGPIKFSFSVLRHKKVTSLAVERRRERAGTVDFGAQA